MSQKPLSFYGQLNLTKINEALKSGNIKAQKIQTKQGEQIVFDINVWVHEEADSYNNNASIQMQLKQQAYEANVPNSYYIGNLKYKAPVSTEVSNNDICNNIIDENKVNF